MLYKADRDVQMADVKICGIRDEKALQAAVEAGVRHIGFVFYPDSPRYIKPDQAKVLAEATPKSVRRVGLFVDPGSEGLEKILGTVELDMIQLHGDESPERVTEIKQKFGKPVMKALKIATKYDMEGLEDYEAAADWLLFDSKSADAEMPGGTGQSFDWSVLKDRTFQKPWMLSGGLNHENVSDALSLLNPKVVDVSSGVESEPGVKDPDKIREFVNIARNQ